MPDQSRLNGTDIQAYNAFPDAMALLIAPHLSVDDTGLIGRNRKWKALYSPRFQMGAGAALRITIAAGRPAEAARAFRAVEAGTEVIRPNGSVPSTLPPHIKGTPSLSDIASGAAFFLGDACLGYLSTEASPFAEKIASRQRRIDVRKKLALAVS